MRVDWESEEAIRVWKTNAEHQEAQKRLREDWYANFDRQICGVDRAYSGGAHRESFESNKCPELKWFNGRRRA
jgi:hypothetical protein